jgi:NADH-quinone oxidoreductase subunit G
MSEEFVNIQVNGEPVKARKGEMIIASTDREGVYVPRFCYHEKLKVAANCRMCLVEVEKAPKPLPACATPVAEGMKIFTRSPKAIGAQKATMEFLLINHPLDCPICDQGGECELQDLAVGFGRDISRFHERKRVVPDENLGPLIATDMTRCIHCTRCIRFTEEIAGFQELGMIGRGEQMKVRVAVEQTVQHEMSGNVIDLCPVGALVSKPYRFRARSWEMTSHPLVSPHDGVGSNLFGHVLRGKLMRVVPRENEAINETWISDRDRFSYEGVYSADRVLAPAMRVGEEWGDTDWQSALNHVAEGLRANAGELGVLASASSTVEELYLLNRITRGLGAKNIDHRLRQRDVRDQTADPVFPSLGMKIADVDKLGAILIVGSHLRREVPILAHRVRKAAVAGARVSFVNPARFDYLFPVASYIEASPGKQASELAAILAAATEGQAASGVPEHLSAAVRGAKVTDTHRAIASSLAAGNGRAIWLGALAIRSAAYSELRALASALAQATGASFGVLAEGANAAGAFLAGAVPHRDVSGKSVAQPGQSAVEMLRRPLKAYVLFGVEPWADALDSETAKVLREAELVIAITPFASDLLREIAHVILPIGTFAETSGTYVNLEGLWQSQAGAAAPVGEARPGWKVLRVLGNLLDLPNFEYQSSEDVRDELRRQCGDAQGGGYRGTHRVNGASTSTPLVDVNMYQVDAVVRRATSLQKSREGRSPAVIYPG